MAKRGVGRYSNEFRRMCVERMKQCDDIVALSKGTEYSDVTFFLNRIDN